MGLGWMRKLLGTAQDEPLEIICQNPQCATPIKGMVAYIPEWDGFYHPGECPKVAMCHKLQDMLRNGSDAEYLAAHDVRYLSHNKAAKRYRALNHSP